ncbi:MAG: hypothetical protein Q8R57_00165 [Bacteroidota bacterium]|nr:hypothetical protein [Bacteroidota bacterium]
MKKSFYLIAFSLILFAACKKDNPTPVDNNNNNGGAQLTCRYDTVYSSQQGTEIYAYDDKDRIAKITRILNGKETISLYTYTGNKVLMQNEDQTVHYILNNNGFADTVLMDIKGLGYIQVFNTYNSQNQIVKIIQDMEIGGNEVYLEMEQTYLNGNNNTSKILFEGDELILVNEYHLDKENVFKEMEYKTQFIPSNKNLMKASYMDGDLNQSFTYQFDAQNKVISRKIIGPDTQENSETFVWKCK